MSPAAAAMWITLIIRLALSDKRGTSKVPRPRDQLTSPADYDIVDNKALPCREPDI